MGVLNSADRRQKSSINREYESAMKPQLFLFLGAGLALAGCNDSVVPQCPSAAVLADTSALTVFRAGAPRDPSGEAYTATIDNVRTSCVFPKGASASTSTLNFTLRGVRAPSLDGADYALPYYLAVTQGDRILSKTPLTVHLVFAPGSAAASQDVALDDTVVKLEPGHPPTDYALLVGFQLTDAERAYNQTRGRFTP
jgi:hypothetical protein